MKYEKVTLANLGGGVAEELFQREFSRVVANIKDINTLSDDARKVTLEITIHPTDSRDLGEVSMRCFTKLAGVRPAKSTIHFDNRDGFVAQGTQESFEDNVISMNDRVEE